MTRLSQLLILLLVVLFGVSTVFGAQYTAGTYEGSAQGRSSKEHSGEVKVKVTVTDSKIEKIEVVSYEQSIEHKKYGKSVAEAKEKVPAAVIEKQSLGADAIAEATISSNALELAIARALDQASPKKYVAGTYEGSTQGRASKGHTGEIAVKVTVTESKIEKIEVVTYEQSVDHKKYGEPIAQAKDAIPAFVLENQSLGADVVAKASTTSVALELAIARALEQARGK